MFRSALRIPRVRAATTAAAPSMAMRQQRSLHYMPRLDHDFSEGVPGLLSADGFDMAWNQYMSLMLEKLNALIAGSSAFHPSPPAIESPG